MTIFEKVFTVTVVILFLAITNSTAQIQDDGNELYSQYDQLTGISNTHIYNGRAFTSEYRILNDQHQFFKQSDFVASTIVYGNQSYKDVPVLYDVFNDQVLTKVVTAYGTEIIRLVKERVKSFRIGVHLFVLRRYNGKLSFFEKVYHNDYVDFYKNYKKRVSKKISNGEIYYEFKDAKEEYYLHSSEGYLKIEKPKDILLAYPAFKKKFNSIYNRTIHKNNPEASFIAILKQMNQLAHTS